MHAQADLDEHTWWAARDEKIYVATRRVLIGKLPEPLEFSSDMLAPDCPVANGCEEAILEEIRHISFDQVLLWAQAILETGYDTSSMALSELTSLRLHLNNMKEIKFDPQIIGSRKKTKGSFKRIK